MLIGNAAPNKLAGGRGDDILIRIGAGDKLRGGPGKNRLGGLALLRVRRLLG